MELLEELLPKNNIKEIYGCDNEFGFPLSITCRDAHLVRNSNYWSRWFIDRPDLGVLGL